MTLTTTFTLLRKHDACAGGFKKLAKHLGSVTKYGADTPIDLLTILDSNGVVDTLWTLRATQEPEIALDVARRFALDCATHMLPTFESHYPNDLRPRKAIQAVHDYRAGKITVAELRAAATYAYADYAAYAYAAYVYAASTYADAAAVYAYTTYAYAYADYTVYAYAAYTVYAYAARAAYDDAYTAYAYAAERKWQADRLQQYLRGENPEMLALPERRAT